MRFQLPFGMNEMKLNVRHELSEKGDNDEGLIILVENRDLIHGRHIRNAGRHHRSRR